MRSAYGPVEAGVSGLYLRFDRVALSESAADARRKIEDS